MGLLDDAIRQHLDLKRQHGADPSEVAEKERQAFGPIKRGDLEVGTAPEDDAPAYENDPEHDAPVLESDPEGAASAPKEAWADEPAVAAPEASGSVILEPASEPVEDDAPAAQPVEDAAPAARPVEDAAPAAEPIEDAAAGETPFVAPLDEPFAPSAEPAAYAPDRSPAEPVEPAYEPPPAPAPNESFEDIGEPTQEYAVAEEASVHEPDPQPDAVPGEHDELEETPDFLEETPEHDRLWFEQKPPRDFDF